MATYSFWALGKSHITVSGGGSLDGITQGDGSHLVGRQITLDSFDFEQLNLRDTGSDVNFDDNDSDQRLKGRQWFDGTRYSNNTQVEAEYRIVMRDPDTGAEYEAVGVNVVNSSQSYATIEGLAFIDTIPPAGVALEVTVAFEGPGGFGQPSLDNVDIAEPACFTPGTLIETPQGLRPVESLREGDFVRTVDGGDKPLIWVGQTLLSMRDFAMGPTARPVLIRAGAFGPGLPCRDLRVSPQHRILLSGPDVELLFGEPEVLAAAGHLVNGHSIVVDQTVEQVIYIHLQCQDHELLLSEGLASESYNPGAQSLRGFPATARARLSHVLHAATSDDGPALDAVRPLIKRHEAALWRRAA